MKKSFAKVYSAQTYLMKPVLVTVEVDVSRGLHAFSLVGLPSKAVEEAKDRVSSAVKNTGFKSPKQTNKKIVVALAPANLKKEGAAFDLGIALAYLLASGDIEFDPEGRMFIGELSLDGKVRGVSGVLPLVRFAKDNGFREVYVPSENGVEAALIDGIEVYGVETLAEVVEHLNTKKPDPKDSGQGPNKTEQPPSDVLERKKLTPLPKTEIVYTRPETEVTLDDIRGQETAKRGLEIAAAGGHNIAFYGPPGTGKTLLAKAFTSLLPELSFAEVLEVTGIHSTAGTLQEALITYPPFRSPHHTASYVSLVGGGATPKPGEITLAHRGVLFLDEFPEFDKRVLESLRQPLEDKVVSISRSKGSAQFPADFILIAAMNPCPCGNKGGPKECVCDVRALARYERKLSGPIVDRIDMWIEVAHIDYEKLSASSKKQNTSEHDEARRRIKNARALGEQRLGKDKKNSDMTMKEIDELNLSANIKDTLNTSARQLGLSPRSYHRIIKLARTIADLEGSAEIELPHLLEALQYRKKD